MFSGLEGSRPLSFSLLRAGRQTMKNPSHWMPYCCARDCLYNIVYAMLAIVDHLFIIVSLGTYDLYLRMTLSQFCHCDDENLQKLLDASDIETRGGLHLH